MRKQIGALALAASIFLATPTLASSLDSTYLDAGVEQLKTSQTAAVEGDFELACFYAKSSQHAFLRVLNTVDEARAFYELSKKFERDYCV